MLVKVLVETGVNKKKRWISQLLQDALGARLLRILLTFKEVKGSKITRWGVMLASNWTLRAGQDC